MIKNNFLLNLILKQNILEAFMMQHEAAVMDIAVGELARR